MKKTLIILMSAALLVCGCHNEIENELGQLERRFSNLEDICMQLNRDVESLQRLISTLDKFDYITKIETNYDLDYNVKGYTLYFTHSAPVSLTNGVDAETPRLGVQMLSDGLYYWNIQYPSEAKPRLITNEFGQYIAATAVCPMFKIAESTDPLHKGRMDWFISYDNGEIWQDLGQAQGDAGRSFVKTVDTQSEPGYVIITLADGTTQMKFPLWATYESVVEAVTRAEANQKAFQALFEGLGGKVFAKDIVNIVDGGNVIGYKIILSNGKDLSLYNGVPSNIPVLGAAKDKDAPTDTAYYWNITYPGETAPQWILCDGKKVRADADRSTGSSVRIEPQYDFYAGTFIWKISYDGGKNYSNLTYNGGNIVAQAPTESELVTGCVEVLGDRVKVTTKDGSVFYIPRYKEIEFVPTQGIDEVLGNYVVNVFSGSATCKIRIAEGNDKYDVLVVTNDGFFASVSHTDDYKDWTIVVNRPAGFSGTSSTMNVVISDGEGSMRTETFILSNIQK